MKKEKGFSLIELLVVMFVLAILSAVLLPNLLGARQKAKDAQLISDMNAIKNALRLYYNETQNYPETKDDALAILPTYMKGIGSTDFEYSTDATRESFTIIFDLNSTTGDEDTASQAKCGIDPPVNGRYAVCSF